MRKIGVGHSRIFRSVWCAVEAVNELNELCVEYPSDKQDQLNIEGEIEKAAELVLAIVLEQSMVCSYGSKNQNLMMQKKLE
mmetsp:Transcript_31843/g.48732  ORF Transcript_31843/g.48732 Transcript_31843/m.48732 type:complete len:81 (+) Transcript_31843:1-243(+)